jgi:hypothetical protein
MTHPGALERLSARQGIVAAKFGIVVDERGNRVTRCSGHAKLVAGVRPSCEATCVRAVARHAALEVDQPTSEVDLIPEKRSRCNDATAAVEATAADAAP